eukprot:CAMPEP_0195594306 /NCGR_PEP_ID=MMETSP0815-20121206/1347_1 /TAXON_ID=97485 /ORGANISM="Prymnesium parvum, Strain Texoma1" /LENGTH=126 /DNA_ID=CAMNT_0040733503 /DNA_START=213 /DNA_END=590 /DNA_ORIENTATION=-
MNRRLSRLRPAATKYAYGGRMWLALDIAPCSSSLVRSKALHAQLHRPPSLSLSSHDRTGTHANMLSCPYLTPHVACLLAAHPTRMAVLAGMARPAGSTCSRSLATSRLSAVAAASARLAARSSSGA